MGSILNRIDQYIYIKRIDRITFERTAGLSRGACYKMGVSSHARTFDKISHAFPDLNINWLRTGIGQMINSGCENGADGLLINPNNDKQTTIPMVLLLQMNNTANFQNETIRSQNEIIKSQNEIIKYQQEQITKMQEEICFLYGEKEKSRTTP